MQMTRRRFTNSLFLLTVAFSAPFTMVGCGVFNDILTWVPIGISALNGIIVVLGPLVPPGAATIITLIKAAFADLVATVQEYQNDSNPADKMNLIAKIRTILGDIVTNFQSFLDQLNVGNNPIEAIVIGLANVILGAIAGFMGQLPVVPGTKAAPRTFSLGGKPMPVVAKYYKSAKSFKADYNQIAETYHHPEIDLK
jgi:hypothetical protein